MKLEHSDVERMKTTDIYAYSSFELQLNVLKEAERSLDNTHLHNTDPKCSYLLIYLTRILIYPIDNKSILFFWRSKIIF